MDATPWPQPTPPEAFQRRRERLSRRLVTPALIAAGAAPSRNFPHNRYRFRASSHFLYLVGLRLEHAVLLLDGDSSAVFVPESAPEDSLWIGPAPSSDELAQRCGIEVKPIGKLPKLDPTTASLPVQDRATSAKLMSWLGRDAVNAGAPAEHPGPTLDQDRSLAEAIIAERLVCDQAGLDQIRQALAVTARAHATGMRQTQPNQREAQVRAVMEAVILGAGMGTAYNSIVTSHGEVLHNERYDREIGLGDLLLADVGAETPEGWASDVTRTWPVGERFSSAQRELYELVLAAQHQAIARVRPGAEYRDVHRSAGRALVAGLVELGVYRGDPQELWADGAADFFFPHGVGHLLGLDVHDMEDLGDAAGYAPGRGRSRSGNERYLRLDRQLEAGMVVTIEPGFYWIEALIEQLKGSPLAGATNFNRLEQFRGVRGIRIEDDVLVTNQGSEVLSSTIPKDVAAVEELRARRRNAPAPSF